MFEPPAPAVRRLRIVVLRVTDVWCEVCAALCATTIAYVVEEPDGVPRGLGLLSYCPACEMRDVP